MINISLHALSLEKKIVFSSALTGLILYFGFPSVQATPSLATNNFLGVPASLWIWAAYFGSLMAWPEIWKKDFKSAALQSIGAAAIYVIIRGYTALLPHPLNGFFGILGFIPFHFLMLYGKIAVAQGTWRVEKQIVLQKLLATLCLNSLLYYLPVLMIGYETYSVYVRDVTFYLQGPLFYLIFFSTLQGKKWQDLFSFSSLTGARFVISFFLSWLTLLFAITQLYAALPDLNLQFIGRLEEDKQLIALAGTLVRCFYYGFTMLVLCYLCVRILNSWHTTIKQPLGWSYLLSFVPVLNIFTVISLLRRRPDSWSNASSWQQHLDEERTKLATGMTILSILSALASGIFAVLVNYQPLESSLYSSLILSALSAATVYGLYRGWVPFWAMALVYIGLNGFILSLNAYSDYQTIIFTLVVRCVALLIYSEAIKPSANHHLREQVVTTQSS